jgi:hypothetical protein
MESLLKWKLFAVSMGWAGSVSNGVIMIGVE